VAFAFVGSETIDISGGRDVGVLIGLPAGKYIVMAKAQFDHDQDLPESTVECTLDVGGVPESSAVRLSSPGTATLPFLAPADLTGVGGAILSCIGDDVRASNVKLTAIQVDTLVPVP
jgi:hypothetical protein